MKKNREGQTHFELPINITDTEIEAIEEAINLMKNKHFYSLMKEEVDILQGLIDKVNKK